MCTCMCMCMYICITPGSFLTGYGLMGRDLLPTAVITCLKFLIYFTKLQKLCGNEFTTLSWSKHRFSWDLESLIRVCSCLSKVVFCQTGVPYTGAMSQLRVCLTIHHYVGTYTYIYEQKACIEGDVYTYQVLLKSNMCQQGHMDTR